MTDLYIAEVMAADSIIEQLYNTKPTLNDVIYHVQLEAKRLNPSDIFEYMRADVCMRMRVIEQLGL